jgi:histidinol-phosphate aminotransferase
MYEFVAEAHGVTVESVPLDQDFLLDANANLADAESSRLKLIFVCNPNNPTGGLMPLEAMRRLLDRFRENALVVVDEAYIEYCPDHSVVPLLAEYPNLVVIRTLSKAFALAAIRVGFLLARQDVLEQVNKLIAPYPMPDASARIALRALSSDGLAYMRGHCGLSIERRDHLREALLKVDGVDDIAASDTNFLLVRFSDAKRVMNSLKSAGIILRDQTHLARLPAHLRITVGSDEENAALLDHLQRLAARG